MRLWWTLVCSSALAACYEPPHACGIQCTTTCPDGLTCQAGVCMPSDGSKCTMPSLDFQSFGVGARFVCGLETGGAIDCWGDNHAHQIGTASMQPFYVAPTRVGTQTWSALAVGAAHACGLAQGAVQCWGDNTYGQAQGGSGAQILTPSPVAFMQPPPAFDSIAAGARNTCALGQGQLWCWGAADGLGNGGMQVSYGIHVPGPDDWTEVSIGRSHACAISASLGLMCWGINDNDQAVPGGPRPVAAPTPVALPNGRIALHVYAGDENTCVVASTDPTAAAGEVWCWGRNEQNVPISLPNAGQNVNITAPTQLGSDATWTQIRSNERVACGVRAGQALCWGSEDYGELGDGFWNAFRSDVAAQSPLGAADAVLTSQGLDNGQRDEMTCMQTGTKLACWGTNASGELGQGVRGQNPTPVEIAPPSGGTWASAVIGRYHTCGKASDGKVYCWGYDGRGAVRGSVARGSSQACIPSEPCDAAEPTPAPAGIASPDEMIAGEDYTCVRQGSAVSCWGNNDAGTLGPNASGDLVVAVPGTFARLFGGDRASCAVTTGGELQCWGYVAGVPQPTPMVPSYTEINGPRDVRFGDDFGCLTRDADSARLCWGDNSNGELGDGTQNPNATPPPQEIGTVQMVVANQRHACEITSGGGVSCWGDNYFLQTGQVGVQTVLFPAAVSDAAGALSGCTDLATGDWQTCAICGGMAKCWGYNGEGELGRGTPSDPSAMAAPVLLPTSHTWARIFVGWGHACALDTGGHLACWGDSEHGQVGDGGHATNYPILVAP